MTILETIRQRALEHPAKPAIIFYGDIQESITYVELVGRMEEKGPLPIPLLGESWNGPFFLTTTGTTGQRKTVVISQEAVIANTGNLIESQGYSKDTVFIITGAITHLGSWSKIFPTLMLGGTLIVLPGMKDINLFFKALDYPSQHLATFLVPAGIRLLLQFSADRLAGYGDKVEFLETGAAPMSCEDMLKLCTALPKTRLYNTYASTETGIVATYEYNFGGVRSGCVGKPLKNSSVRVQPDGQIVCGGQTLMEGYLNDPVFTESILQDNMIHTSDLGYFDEEGRLYIKGRKDDVLNIGGYNINPAEIEQVAMEYSNVEDCICIPYQHKVLGPILKLLIKLRGNIKLDKRELVNFMLTRLDREKIPQLYEQVDHIERTFNGKLNRKYYVVKGSESQS